MPRPKTKKSAKPKSAANKTEANVAEMPTPELPLTDAAEAAPAAEPTEVIEAAGEGEPSTPSNGEESPTARQHGHRRKKGRRRSGNGRPQRSETGAVDATGEPAKNQEAAVLTVNIAKLQAMSMTELNKMAKDIGVENFGTMRKHEVIFHILQKNAERAGVLFSEGVLEVLPEGFGFLRSQSFNYLPCPEDIYVSPVANPPVRFADRQPDRRPDSSAEGEGEVLCAAQGRRRGSAKIRTRRRTRPISTT